MFNGSNSPKGAHELFNLSRSQLTVLTGLLTECCHWKGHLFTLGSADSPVRDRRKQPSETSSHVHCDCEALAIL